MSPDEWSSERRRVARRLHPDLGGDLDAYIAAMRELDRQQAAARASGPQRSTEFDAPTVAYSTARVRTVRVLAGRARAVTTVVRQHLPRGWPGARRYGRL